MSTSHNEGGDGGGGEGSGNGVSLLVDVDLSVPSSPCAGGGEHSSSTAHVSEGSLSSTVCTSSGNSGNTGNGSTGTPRLGRGLHAGGLCNSVCLSVILAQVALNILHDIVSDGGKEHRGLGDLADNLTVCAVNLN